MSRDCRTDRGVSPVIGVILMVAIVVILAAVIGTYVVGFGDAGQEPAPNVRFSAVYDDRTTGNGHYLNVTIEGGETVQTENLEFVVNGATDGSGGDESLTTDPVDQAGTELITADTISIDKTSFGLGGSGDTLDLSDATVTLVWDPDPDAGEPGPTQSLWTWEAD